MRRLLRPSRLSLLLAALLLISCKSVEYVPVETVKTETVYRSDTVRTSDSVLISAIDTVIIRGDTVAKVQWRTRDVVRNIYKTKTDTIARIECMEVPKMIEWEPTAWQRIRLFAGDITLIMLGALLSWSLYWFIRDLIKPNKKT